MTLEVADCLQPLLLLDALFFDYAEVFWADFFEQFLRLIFFKYVDEMNE